MASHKRKKRRSNNSLGSAVEVSLGGLPFMGDSFRFADIVVGIGMGVVGSALVKGLFKKFMPPATYAKIASTVGKGMPLLAGAVVATGLSMAGKKGIGGAGMQGYAAGAAITGAVLSGWDLAKDKLATMAPEYFDYNEVVSVNMGGYGNYGGVLINDRSDGLGGYGGVLIADKSDGLNELAAMSMAPDDDGLAALSMFR
jgi:hypothetical protein